MSSHNLPEQLNNAEYRTWSNVTAAVLTCIKFFEHFVLESAGAETRTLDTPVKAGQTAVLSMATDGGDITVTVTGGYNEDGDTTIVFSDPGQYVVLMSIHLTASTFGWRKIADYATTNLSLTEAGYLNGITAGTGAASKALILDANGDVVMPATGMFGMSRAALAAAGSAASDAAVIATQVVAVTAADNVTGVALPAAATTEGPILVINTVATATLLVYPVNGGNDQINGLAEDIAIEVGPGESAWFIPTSATQWYTPRPANLFKVETVAATRILTAADNGKTIILSHATEFDTKLPAPAVGLHFLFYVGNAPETASYTITTNGTTQNIIYGSISSSDLDAGGDAALTNATAVDVVTFVDAKAKIGDWVELHCDGTNWFLRGHCQVFDAITLA